MALGKDGVLYESRSALECNQRCPREYYLTYHALGRGLSPARTNSDIAIGIARHEGVQKLIEGVDIEGAVNVADGAYLEMTEAGLSGYENVPSIIAVRTEHRSIIEAGLRVWAARRLPVIKQMYEVLAVEQERSCSWEVLDQYANIHKVIFEGRIDAELLDRQDNRVYAFSLKNPREYNAKRHPDCMIDMQGKSESWLIGNVYGHERAGGVLMEYIMAGQEKDDKYAPDKFGDDGGAALGGNKIRWTPLVRGWMRPQEAGGMEYAWRFKYDNPLYNPDMSAHKFQNPRARTFTKSERAVAWEYPGGVKKWVQDLLEQKFVPREVDPGAAEELFFAPPPYYRDAKTIASWLYATVEATKVTVNNLTMLASGEKNIDQAFPQHETSCINKFGLMCSMFAICHKGAGDDPLNKGYKMREPHHMKEKEALGL